jgi:excinuclease ABC subunit B
MERALAETERRREKQIAHNKAHGITPQSTKALISDLARDDDEGRKAAMGQTFVGHRSVRGRGYAAGSDLAGLAAGFGEDGATYADGTPIGGNLKTVIASLEKDMREAAANLEFEEAARLRDEIRRLQETELAIADDPMVRQYEVENRTAEGSGGRIAKSEGTVSRALSKPKSAGYPRRKRRHS